MGVVMNVLPPEERPRERLLKYGPTALSNTELLALVLRTGDSHTSVLSLCQKLLSTYSLKQLTRAHPSTLMRFDGIGQAKACQLVASFELGRRTFSIVDQEKPVITTSEDVYRLVAGELYGLQQEHVILLLIDSRQRLLKKETLFIGTLNSSTIHAREIFCRAIQERAAGLILAHNHPSNDCTPSKEDIKITRELFSAGKILGVDVLDHIIVTDAAYYSFAEDHTTQLNP